MKIYKLLILTLALFFCSCKHRNIIIGYWQLESSGGIFGNQVNDSIITKVNFYSSDSFSFESYKHEKLLSKHSFAYKLINNKTLLLYNSKLAESEQKILKLDDSLLEFKEVYGDQRSCKYKRILK